MYCTQCGAENPDTNRFCQQCGTALTPITEMQDKQPNVAVAQPQESHPVGKGPSTRRSSSVLLVAAVAVTLVVFVSIIIFVVFPALRGQNKSQLIVASLSRNGDADLYLSRIGQELDRSTLLVEDVQSGTASGQYVWLSIAQKGRHGTRDLPDLLGYYGGYCGFLPNNNYIGVYLIKQTNT